MSDPDTDLVEALLNASRVVLLTGAGVSTASGLPDYRGPQGVWKTRTPIFFQDFLADPAERARDWRQHAEDRAICRQAHPGPAHLAAVRLEQAGKLECLITQNIDGLHTAAGTSPGRLVELHGALADAECVECGRRFPGDPVYEKFLAAARVPACPCGGWLKPAVISFGQSLREADLQRAVAAASAADLFIALGTTLSVQPASLLGLQAARAGTPYFVLNLGDTEHDGHPLVRKRIEGDVNEVFPAAVDAAILMGGG